MALAPAAPPPHEPLPPEMEPLLAIIRTGNMSVVGEVEALWHRHPNCPDLLRHLIFVHAARREHERAIELCHELLKIEPGNPETHLCIADRLVRMGRLDEAEAAYREIQRTCPAHEGPPIGIRYVDYLRRRGGRSEAEGEDEPLRRRTATKRQEANRRLNAAEWEAGRLRLRSMPPRLNVEGTHRCNFYCQTCLKGYGAYFAADMEAGVLAKVREELIPTATGIGISGYGEPTIGNLFDDILDTCVAEGAALDMTTNATGLNFRRIEQMIRHKVAVNISVDGATKETFERIRLGGSFEQLLGHLATILRLRRIHVDQLLSAWHFNFVAVRSNVHELPGVVRLAARYDIASIHVIDYSLNWNAFDAESLRNDPALARRWFAEARRVAQETGVALTLPPDHAETSIPTVPLPLWRRIRAAGRLFPKRRRFPQRCGSPWIHPFITPTGDVQPCCAHPPIGSIRNRPFRSVWNGWRYRVLRLRIHTAFPPLACRHCHVETGINAGNAGNCIAQEGLIIKTLYWIEIRLRRGGRWAWTKIIRAKPPAPNYERGRPITGG
ncbi:MAG: SPASM domain-containing protein [Candidatus Sumerlaeia bacterium]|nr:SPASM domain-containing protein [Candidatus Sumerlaeia bacterium]